MKIIAVTGGIGSGKSTIAREFERLGAHLIDADKISYEIMLPGGAAYNEVIKSFGSGILTESGEIDRKALGGIVFADSEKLRLLNEITHKLIYAEMKERIAQAQAEVVCLEIPLLFSAPCPFDLDMKIAVVADRDIRINRVIGRDNCTKEQVEARMAKQLSDCELRALADFVIENNGGLDSLRRQTEEVFARLKLNGG